MQNGQGSGSTETGAYTLSGATSGTAPAKNAGAKFYIPTENEWYKAAYYSLEIHLGSDGYYYRYATQSDGAPGNVVGSETNQANYYVYNFSVTQTSQYSANQNYLTDVGAFTNSASFYGTFDQNGNVSQWNDLDGTAGSLRGFRGGYWFSDAINGSSAQRFTSNPSHEGTYAGFRLASPVAVPEPSTWVMVAVGIACAGWQGYRRRRAR
jgi:formylglycine-generating enzyme required for sulfatase activity